MWLRMDIWIWTVLVTVCVWLYYRFKKNLNYFKDRNVPYVPGWPLLGNMANPILRLKHVSDAVLDMYNFHPEAKYVGVFDFVRPVVMLRDPDLIKSVTIKNFDNFPDHKSFIDDSLDPLFGGNLFNMAGDKWREARNLLSPAFTSSKMKAMYELMVKCGENFLNHIARRSAEENRMVATKDLFTKYTNDVIATCAFGISVDTLKDPDNEFYQLGKTATDPENLTRKFFIARSFPRIMRLFNIKFVSERTGNFFKNIVSSTVRMREEKGISRPDMIQLMMDARGKEGNKHLKLDITEMTAQAFIFFFGGFDTTSTQMCIIAHELAINPDIQRKLQDEIDEVMRGSNGKPTYDAINGMPYLDAIFNESMRRHTQVAFIDRLCTKSFELPPAFPGGEPFVLEPGMNIWVPATAIHMDPKYYDNPRKFDPERYYRKKVTINDVTNLGFGIGPRSCIGNRFAILETKILLFFLLNKFSLKPNEKTSQPLVYSKKSFVIAADGGFWLTIEERK